LTPDWMPGAVPRCVPTIVKQNQHGTHAGAIVVGTERIRVRGAGARATWRTIDIFACPVTFSPHPQQIEAARRGYDDWWQALGWVREGLIAGGMLREVEVTAAMPKAQPWQRPPRQPTAETRLRAQQEPPSAQLWDAKRLKPL
ncbi:MAG TPA: hypothetical protein PLM52_19825, partial [Tabrizicola sp.]|nr:hypothetical protein [Tabrizicola sp.]